MAATVAGLRTYLGIDPASTVDEEAMTAAVAAANDFVAVLRPDLTHDPDGAPLTEWPARVDQAALVQAARLYGRRGSVQGIAAFADIGVSMLPRLDPEVRSLLELGEYQPSVVA
ncbi:MAG: hypothetical protein ABWY50_06980 [Aeromicrobium sp.]